MHLDYLDKLIPKRWVLLLRYWLPFFKTPSNFYFECRFFINKLKRLGYQSFPWEKLADLVFIFEKNAGAVAEIDLSKKILDTIFTEKTQPIAQKLIEWFFERFNPDNTRTPFVNEVFQQLPPKLYSEYFSQLNAANCSSKNLKWCARLKEKFYLEDKLSFILSLPDDKLIENESTLFNLAIQECEEELINPKLGFNKTLSSYIIDQLLEFIFTRNPTLIFSNTFIRALITQLLKTQNPILTSHILELDESARYHFFENFLSNNQNSQNFQENIQYFLHLCPEEQWPDLIDQLITSVFNATESEMTDNNPDLFLLTQLQESYVTYPLNLFQFLAIQNLTKKPLDLEALKKVFTANPGSLEQRKNFSIECQSAIAENIIHAIKVFIKNHYMIYVPKENSRRDIHRAFYQFFNNEFIGKPLNVAKLILKKLPDHLQSTYEADLNFLQELLTQLYLVLEDPAIAQYKNECLMAWNKAQRDYEEKSAARRELLQRIREGKQSSIAYQRMEELFGAEAQTMQEKWKKTLGVHFFDANDKKERKIAILEAAEIIKFNRECNDFSCLTPASVSYFSL